LPCCLIASNRATRIAGKVEQIHHKKPVLCYCQKSGKTNCQQYGKILAPPVFGWPGLRLASFGSGMRRIPVSRLGRVGCRFECIGVAVISRLRTYLQQLRRDLFNRPAPIGRDEAPSEIGDAVPVFAGRSLAWRRTLETAFVTRPFAYACAGAGAGRGSERRLWIIRRD
jgi:hypothetical protein